MTGYVVEGLLRNAVDRDLDGGRQRRQVVVLRGFVVDPQPLALRGVPFAEAAQGDDQAQLVEGGRTQIVDQPPDVAYRGPQLFFQLDHEGVGGVRVARDQLAQDAGLNVQARELRA